MKWRAWVLEDGCLGEVKRSVSKHVFLCWGLPLPLSSPSYFFLCPAGSDGFTTDLKKLSAMAQWKGDSCHTYQEPLRPILPLCPARDQASHPSGSTSACYARMHFV